MSRSFAESIDTTYSREHIAESSIHEASIQKVLRLFGYGSGTDARYVCCLGQSPRIDIHKFKIGVQNLIMCIITDNNSVLDSALWSITPGLWNRISKYEFGDSASVNEVDDKLRKFAGDACECLMRYTP